MSKIAGWIGKDGYPIASKEHHGTAFKFIGDLSPKKTVQEIQEEDDPEAQTWD